MREPHVVYRFGCLDVGITPAHAGTTDLDEFPDD